MDYDYIRQAYGRSFEPGQRVFFTEYAQPGTVMRPQGDPKYVQVRFDDGKIGACHPLSVEPIEARQPHTNGSHTDAMTTDEI